MDIIKRGPGRPRKDEIAKTYAERNVSIRSVDFEDKVQRKYTKIEWLEKFYRLNDTIRACVDAISYAAVQSGYHFENYGENIKDKEEVAKRKIQNILLRRQFEDINEEDDASDLLLDTFLDLLTFGDAYWEQVVAYRALPDFLDYIQNPDPSVSPWDIKIPYKFYKVSAYSMTIKMSDGVVTGYEQKDDQGNVINEFDPREIIHFRLSSPIDEVNGLAPSATLQNTIAADIYAADYNAKFFENNATPRLHIDLGTVSPEELKHFCAEAEKELKGKPHRNLVTRGGVKVEPIGIKNTDMEFADYQTSLQQRILAMYRVQPIILGIQKTAQGATADSQIALFKFLAVDPIRRIVTSRINKRVIKKLYPTVQSRFAFNPIDRLDQAAQSNVDQRDLQTGIKVVNEVRAERGLSRVDWGDEPIPMPGQNIPGKTPPKTGEPDGTNNDGNK